MAAPMTKTEKEKQNGRAHDGAKKKSKNTAPGRFNPVTQSAPENLLIFKNGGFI